VMLAEIKDAVAKFYNVTLMELEGESRDAAIVKPRHVGMYLARKLTRNGLPSIAHAFNRSHHTTSLNAFQRISRKLEHDEGLRAEISVLMGILDKTGRPA